MDSQGSHWSERLQQLAVSGSSALQPVSKHNDLHAMETEEGRYLPRPPSWQTTLGPFLRSRLPQIPGIKATLQMFTEGLRSQRFTAGC